MTRRPRTHACVIALGVSLGGCSDGLLEISILSPAPNRGGAPAGGELPTGLTPCEQRFDHVPGGTVDWTRGVMRVEGRGLRRQGQNVPMVKRGALLDAARNAIALAGAIPLDRSRRLQSAANWERRIEGRVQGHREVRTYSIPGTDPPEYRVVIEVPLWGVGGVVEVFVDDERSRVVRTGAARRSIPGGMRRSAEPITILLDARGQSVDPTLFPTIVDARGRVVYDMNSVDRGVAGTRPVVRYAESDLPPDRLGSVLRQGSGGRVLLASFQVDPPEKPQADQQAGRVDERTASEKPRRRPRRPVGKIAPFRSRKYDGKFHITEQTYDKMVKTSGFATAVKNAEVIIVVDAPSAGREARRRGIGRSLASAARMN